MISEDSSGRRQTAVARVGAGRRTACTASTSARAVCPQIECIPCSFYGSQPLVYFFPELALSTLPRLQGLPVSLDGAPGPGSSAAAPWETPPPLITRTPRTRGYQFTTQTASRWAAMLDRYLTVPRQRRSFSGSSIRRSRRPSTYTIGAQPRARRRGEHARPTWSARAASPGRPSGSSWSTGGGIVPHVGGVHLAMLRDGRADGRAGRATRPFAEQCRTVDRSRARKASNTKMWTGRYYLTLWDEKAGKKSDLIFAYQLDGEWMAALPRPARRLPARSRPHHARDDRASATCRRAPYGAMQLRQAGRDGAPAARVPAGVGYHPYDFFLPEVMMLGMTYMYDGQNELGLELTRRSMDNIVCKQGSTVVHAAHRSGRHAASGVPAPITTRT